MIYLPVHQLEIRYSHLLGFPNCIYSTISPFVKLASGIRIENENTHNAVIHLFFKDSFDTISVRWDRLIYKSESHKQDLTASNQFIQEPFFNLFGKIEETEGFGVITNVLYYSIFTRIKSTSEMESIRSDFEKRFFLDGFDKIIPDKTDVGVIIERHNPEKQLTINIGPYTGPQEIEKHGRGNFNIDDPETLSKISSIGEMMTLNLLHFTNKFNFSDFKNLHKEALSLVKQNWKDE